jgi:hypothetical protein
VDNRSFEDNVLVRLQDLGEAIIRSNPSYRFVSFGELDARTFENVRELAETGLYAGVLVGSALSGLNVKAISSQTLSFFKACEKPIVASAVLCSAPPARRDRTLAVLVLDGVIELETPAGFVSRYAAYPALVSEDCLLAGSSSQAEISLKALRHAQRLAISEADLLAARLYFYGRLPVSRHWLNLWPDSRAVGRDLGLSANGELPRAAASLFTPSHSHDPARQWLSWRRRGNGQTRGHLANRYKLYVTPDPRDLPHAFLEIVDLLPQSSATSLKIGPNAYGLLRPDKLIVYFNQREHLFAFAAALTPRLNELRAQALPFTAALDNVGLLSWGMDPSRDLGRVVWHVDDSWRIWLCNRLASALLAARGAPRHDVPPWRYALGTVALLGIDTRGWFPFDETELSHTSL